MEPFIRLRLLGSQLQNNEIQHFVQEIIRIHGFDKILSFIFNYFLHQYNQTKQYDNDLLNITNIISNIIHSRENVKSSKKDTNKIIPITIDRLPSDLIGKCSSYLCLNDYINFMKTNRIIYCALNSPLTLQKLNAIVSPPPNLTRFAMVKSLRICPEVYNKYEISDQVTHFTHLNRLCLFNGHPNDVEIFINSDKINFSEITHLKLEYFGMDEFCYEFDAFCSLLTQFPNVTHLQLEDVCLSDFDNENENIPKITPKLQVLVCDNLGEDICTHALKNKLMNMYSNQLTELYLDENEGDINIYSFPNLKRLSVLCPKNDSLKRIIDSATDLKVLSLAQCECKETTMDIIIKSFQKFTNMEIVRFICRGNDIQNIVSYIEMGLLNAKKKNRKSLKVSVRILGDANIKMRDIECYIARIMNALDTSNINDVMLMFTISRAMDASKYMNKMVKPFEETHLAILDNSDKYGRKIIISNKHCKINGHFYARKTHF
eukprot:358555_1